MSRVRLEELEPRLLLNGAGFSPPPASYQTSMMRADHAPGGGPESGRFGQGEHAAETPPPPAPSQNHGAVGPRRDDAGAASEPAGGGASETSSANSAGSALIPAAPVGNSGGGNTTPTTGATFNSRAFNASSTTGAGIEAVPSNAPARAPAVADRAIMAFTAPPGFSTQAPAPFFNAAPMPAVRIAYNLELNQPNLPNASPGDAAVPSGRAESEADDLMGGVSEGAERLQPRAAGLATLASSPDLSALERGLQQFLADLGRMRQHFAVRPDSSGLWIWVAVASAAAACKIAHRQLRRSVRADGPRLPDDFRDDAFGPGHE